MTILEPNTLVKTVEEKWGGSAANHRRGGLPQAPGYAGGGREVHS